MKHVCCICLFAFKGEYMKDLIEELLEIMDEECKKSEIYQEKRPTIINIYIEEE